MKKFIKGTLAASGILIMIGIIIIVICASVGGISLFKETFENNEFCFTNINFDNHHMFEDWDLEDNQYSKHLGTQNDIVVGDGSSVDKIKIEIGSASLEVKESKDSQIRLDYDIKDKISCYIEDDSLILKSKGGNRYRNDNHNDKISLYLPKGIFLEYVEIELGAGVINVDTLITDKLSAETGAGSMAFQNLDVKEMDLNVGVGKIDFEGAVKGNINAECGVGKIDIKIDGNRNNWNYDVECAMGKVIIGEDEYSNLAKDIDINYEADNNCDITCAMGKVIISFY